MKIKPLTKKPHITFSAESHSEQKVVKLEFAYSRDLINEFKAQTDARWSANMNFFDLKLCLANLIGTVNKTDHKEINKCFRFHRRYVAFGKD